MDSKAAAIILAGGSGTRFGGLNKVYRDLDGQPVLRWSIDVLAGLVGHVVVVARPQDHSLLEPILEGHEISLASGGETRTGSERAGMDALRDRIGSGAVDVVAIHDGARPFLTAELVNELVVTARQVGGAVPGFVLLDGEGVADASAMYELAGFGRVTVQTPQVFRAAELLAAYDAAPVARASDTAQLMIQHSDVEIALVEGVAGNGKITFPDDL